MKILRVASDFYPSVVGGIAIHAYEMSKMQARMGHEVTVYTTKTNSELPFERKEGFDIVRFKSMMNIIGNSITPSMLAKLIKNKNKFEIIHAHSHLFFSTNLCALIKMIGASPLVITNHGLNSQTAPEWFQNIYTATGAKWTFKSADKIICYTKEEKNGLMEIGIPGHNIDIIHNGINPEIFSPKKMNNNKRILWIGRFTPQKGVEYLIDAFKILKIKYPELKLLMVGRGPNKDKIIEKIYELNLKNSITIRDFVPNNEIPRIYQESDIFVLPSLEEGVPRTILEAMSCGIPVICSELPQLVDIVKGCGFLVPKKDPEAIAERISDIISDRKQAMEFEKAGRDKVIRDYSWKDTVEKTIKLYEDLI